MFITTGNEIINLDDLQSIQIVECAPPPVAYRLCATFKSNRDTLFIDNVDGEAFRTHQDARRMLLELFKILKKIYSDSSKGNYKLMHENSNSVLTFNEVAGDMNFIKVIWNDEVVFEDGERTTDSDVKDFKEKYGNKIVYEINAKIADFHHYILYVRGE